MNKDSKLQIDLKAFNPDSLINSPDVQQLSLDVFFESVGDVLEQEYQGHELNTFLQELKDSDRAFDLIRERVLDFDIKLSQRFSELAQERVELNE